MRAEFSSDLAAAGPVEETTFRTHDGTELFYRKWPARSDKAKGAVVLLHRGHEHGGRVAHLVDELGLHDFAFYAWDARGHGRSPGIRGFSPSFAAFGARSRQFRETHQRLGWLCRRGHGGDCAIRRRGAGRNLGSRLRTAHPRAGPCLACLQRQALCSLRPRRDPALAEAEGPVLRQFLREGEVSHSRSGADCILRKRPADHPAHCLQYTARPL